MWVPLIFYVFCILLSTGVCLQCEYCKSNTESCTGVPHKCAPQENACIILTVEFRKENEVSLATYKGCTKSAYCTASPMSIKFPSYHKRRANKCCGKDLCNTGAAPLPPLRLKPNGMQCPGCFSKDPNCPTTEIINCRGWEVFCVFYEVWTDEAGTISTFSMGGCGNKESCMHEPRIIGVPGLLMETIKKTECTHAPMLINKGHKY